MKSIIELAREAGLGSSLTHNGGDQRVWIEGADWHDELERFAALVRAEVLEEAAGVCEKLAEPYAIGHREKVCAVAIRALKEKT